VAFLFEVLLNCASEVLGPETIDHAPVPTTGLFAASVTLAVDVQSAWSGPAADTVGTAVFVSTTSSVDAAQGAFEIVHLKVALVPTGTPVTPDTGEAGVVIEAVPLTTVHTPVPIVGVLPANVKLPLLQLF